MKALNTPLTSKTRIVIVGAGFGGLAAARDLAQNRNLEVIILDRRNHHLFQPLLYQVAMAGLSPADIAFPIRSLFRFQDSVRVYLAEVTGLSLSEKTLLTSVGEFTFDYLILACGAEHSYFKNPEWEPLAPGLKTVEQATEIRRRVLSAFEEAESLRNQDRSHGLTFVVVGAGPTGVELAGTLAELTRHTLSHDFRNIDPSSARIILIEAGDRILPSFHPDLSKRAMVDLEDLGVNIWTNCRVTEINSDGVRAGQEWIHSKTIIWAAGVKPSPLNSQLNSTLDLQGRVIVTEELNLPDFANVFVIGDQARVNSPNGPLPGLAPVAMQQGRYVASTIEKDLAKQKRVSFKYFDKGQMATIGRRSAVVEFKGLRIGGTIAWWMWIVVHIYYLLGFKNRLSVFSQWVYSYLTYKRGARLITRLNWHSDPESN